MSLELIKDYNKSLQAIYDHVGFEEDWVMYPIFDDTNAFWSVCETTRVIKYAYSMEQYNSDSDYYTDELYTQRFYDKHVYVGQTFTMVFSDLHIGSMKWFVLFSNDKRIS